MPKWINLIIASLCEIGWLYSLKYLNRLKFEEIYKFEFTNRLDAFMIYIALVGYVVFGVLNIIFFAKAIKKISASLAFAAWTGLALVGSTLIDIFILNLDITPLQMLCILSILIGIVGMKFSEKKA